MNVIHFPFRTSSLLRKTDLTTWPIPSVAIPPVSKLPDDFVKIAISSFQSITVPSRSDVRCSKYTIPAEDLAEV